LEHQYIEIEGLKIFGSPHAIRHGTTAFGYERQHGDYVWADLKKVDILVTHGPPLGIMDIGKEEKKHLGCESLLKKVLEIKPQFHIFGHIHEPGGNRVVKNGITFANVSQCGSRRIMKCRPFSFIIEV
jgi:Icc-related predicted phosphoesterase